MNKIYNILVIFSLAFTVTACHRSGVVLDRKNVTVDKTVTTQVTNQMGDTTAQTVATTNSVTEAAKQLP